MHCKFLPKQKTKTGQNDLPKIRDFRCKWPLNLLLHSAPEPSIHEIPPMTHYYPDMTHFGYTYPCHIDTTNDPLLPRYDVFGCTILLTSLRYTIPHSPQTNTKNVPKRPPGNTRLSLQMASASPPALRPGAQHPHDTTSDPFRSRYDARPYTAASSSIPRASESARAS